jgi:O-antigen/teichoic acid export membrane protein
MMLSQIWNRFKLLFLGGKGDALDVEAVRNTGGSFVTKVSGLGLAFLSQLALARLMGAQTFGYYIYVWTWIQVLNMFASLSYDIVSIRFVADYKARREWGLLKAFLRHAYRAMFFFSLAVIALSMAAVGILYRSGLMEHKVAVLFFLALPLLPISAMIKVQTGILRGAGRVICAMALDAVAYPALIALAVGVCAVFGSTPVAPSTALLASVAASLIVSCVQGAYIRRHLISSLKQAQPQFSSREWLGAAASITVSSGFQYLIRQVDILVVGNVVGKTEAGIYSVASRLVGLVPVGLEVANYGSAHMFAHLHGQGLKDVLQRMVYFTARVTFLLTVPTVVFLFLLGDAVIGLFGKEFTGGMVILQVLVLGQLANALSGPNGLLMNMTGHHREMACISGLILICDLFFMWLLVPLWGAVGAAAATSMTLALRNVIVVSRVWRHLRVNSTIFSRKAWSAGAAG